MLSERASRLQLQTLENLSGHASLPVEDETDSGSRHHVCFYFTVRVVYSTRRPSPPYLFLLDQLGAPSMRQLSNMTQRKNL